MGKAVLGGGCAAVPTPVTYEIQQGRPRRVLVLIFFGEGSTTFHKDKEDMGAGG
jgi:hypothetical protein